MVYQNMVYKKGLPICKSFPGFHSGFKESEDSYSNLTVKIIFSFVVPHPNNRKLI
jgi:hypothetical protein